MKKVYFIIIAVFAFIYVIYEVRQRKFSIKESFWWFIASVVMLFLAIFPYSIDWIAKKFNVSYGPSLLFVFCIIFLIFINFRNSKKIAEQQEKIIELSQQVAILKEKNRR
ncbi:MAG: DUF2304 domain-containing protein [Bacilli bacterium]|nr:DUF2304 domain-containing protein [Bacilli bacterium]